MMLGNLGESYYHRGLGLSGQHKLTEAMSCLKQSIILQPEKVEAYNVAGLCAYKLGELEEAKALWQKSLTINPDENNRVGAYSKALKAGNVRSSMQSYNQALIYMKEKQYLAAEKELLHKREAGLQTVKSLNLLGLARYGQGKNKQAIQAWQQALQIDFSHPRTLGYIVACKLPLAKWKNFMKFIGFNRMAEEDV